MKNRQTYSRKVILLKKGLWPSSVCCLFSGLRNVFLLYIVVIKSKFNWQIELTIH